MFSSLDIAASGVQAQQTSVDVISNNLANVSTIGFKKGVPQFTDLLYQNLQRVGTTSSDTGTIIPSGIQLGLGTQLKSIRSDLSQGVPQSTSGPMDLEISGLGYFQITLPDGSTAYTRDGSFQTSPTGEIVTADGYPMVPNITIPQDAISVSVNTSGVVQATIPGQVDPSTLGQIQLATFINPNGLQATGSNLFLETQASGAPVTGIPGIDNIGTVNEGFLESSNVNPVTEITNLITAQRAYEMNTKVITASDQMLQTLNQVG